MHFFSTVAAAAALAGLVNADAYVAAAGPLVQVSAFKDGPTKAGMYVYVPTKKADKAPIIVAIHYCTGTAQKYFSGSNYASLADTHGFIVIYPNSPSSGGCWDVASTGSLTHGKGGDSETIVNMVKYAVTNYGGDADRVFATGSSSGAMMTNVLAGAYPDVFRAGSVYSGVPDGCFYVSGATTGMATPGWSNSCANGQNIKTAQAWGDLVRSYYPGYNGTYPKMQIFHGTADNTLDYPNLAEQMKEWSNVFGISFTKNVTGTPQSGYTQMVYGDGTKLVGYSAQGVGHTVPIHESMDLSWFGIA
ncbi:related to acetylxylan esterase (subclass of the carboxylic acid esterases) [Phialocephala subalpina]|uniref:Carboxylic ester hydrolase n=1 Tax=Phialocephala subalpina TaxID=576137 RepID=A0A1L7WP82_9HELO|nr:related to acetylxylan esterase (subclass of the carboxylic acid esterases) [Phialocephala subalpina]